MPSFLPTRKRASAYSAVGFFVSVVDELIKRFRDDYHLDLTKVRKIERLHPQDAETLKTLPPMGFQSSAEYDQTVRDTVERHLNFFRRYYPEGAVIHESHARPTLLMIQNLTLADLLARLISFSRTRFHLTPEQVASGSFSSMNGFLYMVERMTDGGRRDRTVMLTKDQFQTLCSACPGEHRNIKMEALSQALIASLGPDAPCDLAFLKVEELPSLVNLHIRFQSSMLEAVS